MSCNCFNCSILDEYQAGRLTKHEFEFMRFAYYFGQISALYDIHDGLKDPQDDDMPLDEYIDMTLQHAMSAVSIIQAETNFALDG